MIIYNNRKPVDCINDSSVGVVGENMAYTQEFYIKGIADDSISYTIHLRFADGSVNSVVPSLVRTDEEGTLISWIIKKNDIFSHGCFEVQIEGKNDAGLVFQTEIAKLYADESLPVEDKAYENPNSETLKLRDEVYELFQKLDDYEGGVSDDALVSVKATLAEKEDSSNKVQSFDVNFADASNTLYPTVTAIKKYLSDYYYNHQETYSQDEVNELLESLSGYSPTASVTQTDTGAVITITDKSGTTTATILNGTSGGENVSTETVLSDNLFDKSTAVSGSCFYRSGSGPSLVEQVHSFYAYVELRGAGTYRYHVPYAFIKSDSYCQRVPLLNSDKTFLKNLTAAYVDTSDPNAYLVEVTVTQSDIAEGAVYLAYDGYEPYIDTLMIVKDREYPSEYIPYGYIEVEVAQDASTNALYGKTAIFLGDSICAGTTVGETTPQYGYGWACLIGEANKMMWDNEGKNGAVITAIDGQTRIVTDQIDTALTKHTTADYVIFEGGTNDADLLDESTGLGAISSDYETFDTATFTGAFESLILKILTTYPDAKIGYIIPQKMGQGLFDSANSKRRRYFDRAIEICKKWGVPYVDLWNENPLNPELPLHYDSSLDSAGNIEAGKSYTDGQHLTLAGYEKLVPQIESFMLTI